MCAWSDNGHSTSTATSEAPQIYTLLRNKRGYQQANQAHATIIALLLIKTFASEYLGDVAASEGARVN